MKSFHWYDQCVATLRGYVANIKTTAWADVQAFDATHDQHRAALQEVFATLQRSAVALSRAQSTLEEIAVSTRNTNRLVHQAAATEAANLSVHIESIMSLNASQCPERSQKP